MLFGIRAWELVERVMGYEPQQEEDWQMESHDLCALFEITPALLYTVRFQSLNAL